MSKVAEQQKEVASNEALVKQKEKELQAAKKVLAQSKTNLIALQKEEAAEAAQAAPASEKAKKKKKKPKKKKINSDKDPEQDARPKETKEELLQKAFGSLPDDKKKQPKEKNEPPAAAKVETVPRKKYVPIEPMAQAMSDDELAALKEVYGDTTTYYEQALTMMKEKYGEDAANIHVAQTIYALGTKYDKAGNYVGARQNYMQALTMQRVVYGDTDHPHIAASLHALATVYSREGDYQQVRNYCLKALAMRRQCYAKTYHPEVTDSLYTAAGCCYMLNDLSPAKVYVIEGLNLERAVGKDKSETSELLHQLNQAIIGREKTGDSKGQKAAEQKEIDRLAADIEGTTVGENAKGKKGKKKGKK